MSGLFYEASRIRKSEDERFPFTVDRHFDSASRFAIRQKTAARSGQPFSFDFRLLIY
jgi:hypothetical protein